MPADEWLKKIYHKIRYLYWSSRAKQKGEIPVKCNKSQPSILFLLPEAGINLYVKTLIKISNQLKMLGYQVCFVRCFNVFERCIFMDSESLPIEATQAEKKMLCSYCFRSFEKNVIKNDFEFVDLRHFINDEDSRVIKEIIQKQPNIMYDFSYEDINFSVALEYNLCLYLKRSNLLNLSEKEVFLLRQQVISLYLGYIGVRRLIEKLNITHIVMSEEYSFNMVIKELAERKDISFMNISHPFHKDVDYNHIKLFRKAGFVELRDIVEKWDEFKYLSIPAAQIKEAVDDLIIRMTTKGTFTYSPNKRGDIDLFNKLNLDKNKKTIIAYPSSPDETENALNSYKKRGLSLHEPQDAFLNQFQWLDELIDFVENSAQFQLVIRLHPRMAPNHREKWGCEDTNLFTEKYSKSYKNIRIIWPTDKLSSFDLAEIADIVTISWSSMGLFMARLGLPVVSGLKMALPLPSDQFHLFCKSKDDYFSKLQCDESLNIKSLKLAYRCYNMVTFANCINLSDIAAHDASTTNKLSKNSSILEKAIIENQNLLEMNFSVIQENQSAQIEREEDQELKKQLFRLIHFFMTNKDDCLHAEFPVYIEINPSENVQHYLVLKNKNIEYYYSGDRYQKYSPMIARMVSLSQQFTN